MPGYRQDKYHYIDLAFFTYHTRKGREKKKKKRERKWRTKTKTVLKTFTKNKTKPQFKGSLEAEPHHTISSKIQNFTGLFISKLKHIQLKK